ncbi:CBS domain-containing protein [Bradyrhizobium sp.]|uniref:CBS domain-containing protein n=1 Tax=Bradyrhizobium sp. TaxID=376 RepID=UPI002394B47A|nr:CBS domain-containing protein [Bradyrhizobium sp.]MDE2379944.1 CBS domain-containing protein [Bradyrhizobium sp.]
MIVEAILPAARQRLITLGDEAPLIDAAGLLRDLEADLVVVRDSSGALAGVITKTDVVRQISHCQGASCMATASAVMTRPVVHCRPGDLLTDVWSVMKERHLKNIPILDINSHPIGVLNARDALEALLEELEYEEILLREYVMCVGYH